MKLAAALLAFLLPIGAAGAAPLETFDDRLYLPVRVNGQPTVALLDSAAELTTIDDDLAALLRLRRHGRAIAHGSGPAAAEGAFSEGVRLEALGVRIRTRVAIIDLAELSQRLLGRRVDLILGRELFDHARLRIDIENATVNLVQANTTPSGVHLRLTTERGIEAFPVTVEGHPPVQAVFDLGNGSEVLVGSAYAERIGLNQPDRIVGFSGGGGIGGSMWRRAVTLRSLVVAGREFRDVLAVIDPTPTASDLNLGTSILRHFLITTDFPGHAIWLEPKE